MFTLPWRGELGHDEIVVLATREFLFRTQRCLDLFEKNSKKTKNRHCFPEINILDQSDTKHILSTTYIFTNITRFTDGSFYFFTCKRLLTL